MTDRKPTRRRFLLGAGATGALGIAGCLRLEDDGEGTPGTDGDGSGASAGDDGGVTGERTDDADSDGSGDTSDGGSDGEGADDATEAGDGRPAQGTIYWSFPTGGTVLSSPTVVEGTVYYGSGDRNVYALDAETGEEQWRYRTGEYPLESDSDNRFQQSGVWSTPHVVDGTVYVGSNDFRLYALDAETGEDEWIYEDEDDEDSIGPDRRIHSSPTVVDGSVYFVAVNGLLYSLDTATGEREWRTELREWSETSPTVADGLVYVGTGTDADGIGEFAAYDAETGESVWRVEGPGTDSSATVANGTVYFGSRDEYVYALDAETGEHRWRTETSGPQDIGSPTVSDGTVYATQWTRGLAAIDADSGEHLWTAEETSSAGRQSPTTVGDHVVVVNQDGFMSVVDGESGAIRFQRRLHNQSTDRAEQSSSIVVDGVLFTGGENNRIQAVETGLEGSSDGTRVNLGTLNHHHSWAGTAAQSLDVVNDSGEEYDPA